MRCTKNRMIARSVTQVVSRYEAKERDKASAGFWRNPKGRGQAGGWRCCAACEGITIHCTARLAIHPA